MRYCLVLALVCLSVPNWSAAQIAPQRSPVIDVHLHSISLEGLRAQGPNPVSGAPPLTTVEEHMRQTLAMMERYNIVLGIVSGSLKDVERFRQAAPDRIIAAPLFGRPGLDLAELRTRYGSGQLAAMGEISAQYQGLSPSDPGLEPYLALAEELDVPVGIHTGLSFPGITQMGFPNFRVSLGNPILLEELLNHHPKLRVYIMHGGAPFLAETIGIMSVYPQVYADVAVINWIGGPRGRKQFNSYLMALIDAGLGDRIMFGSDQMAWPDAIGLAIDAIESAEFLSEQQKRDILYNNAARFLRLTPEEVARHHGRPIGE